MVSAFQSTRPRGATAPMALRQASMRVSIHAPAKGATLIILFERRYVISKPLLNTVQKENPITGTMETAESLKAHQSGIQYFAGSLSAKIANNMGLNETKLIFSDRAIQHGRRWVKIRYNPKQVLPLNEVKNLLEMMSDPDEIHFDMRDRTYLLSEIL